MSTAVRLKLASSPVRYQTRDVEYMTAEGKSFLATIYQPDGPGPFPALLNVHGGQWTMAHSSRATDAVINAFLASWGMVVAAIDFRQDPQHHYPDIVADVNYGMRWLRANAAELKGSPSKIGALGSSSGGHLVMLNSMQPNDPRYASMPLAGIRPEDAAPDYVICHSPVLDPEARLAFAQRAGRDDIVKSTGIFFVPPETLQNANPQLMLDRHENIRLAPALIVQGTEDENMDYRSQERFAEAYRAAGGAIRLEKFEGAGHIFITRNAGSPDADRALALIKDFVAAQLAAS